MKVIVGLFIITICCPLGQAQTSVKTSLNVKKTKFYKGRIDDINDVTIALTCKGKSCSGDLTYLRSRDKFKLQNASFVTCKDINRQFS